MLLTFFVMQKVDKLEVLAFCVWFDEEDFKKLKAKPKVSNVSNPVVEEKTTNLTPCFVDYESG